MSPEDALRMARRRLHTQHLANNPLARPEDVVGWFGATQAQEYGPAKWAIGRRCESMTDAAVEKAFADGAILRTHVLRPTWHFVLPADIAWMLELTAPRVFTQSASYYRNVGLDEATLQKSSKIIEKALRGDNHLTRKELKRILEKSGLDLDAMRMSFITMYAELRGVVCSGARQGKQQTYALIEERAPTARTLHTDEALVELTHRYFASHGPATLKDFCWWSSLKVADARRGLEMVGSQLGSEEIDGLRYWFSDSVSASEANSSPIALLPEFDEYVVAYKDSRKVIDAAGVAEAVGGDPLLTAIVADSQVIGRWKPAVRGDAVVIAAELYIDVDDKHRRALNESASEYADFLGLRASLEVSVITP
jgi:hypothetical protein